MSNSILHKHYLRALSHWPKDLLRPTVSFPTSLEARLSRRFLPNAENPNARPTFPSPHEKDEVNALYSLLENRYMTKYPTSAVLTRPASNPTYYEDLLAELEAAPQRSWFDRQLNKWKGFLRFS
ncbi:MAG: hypothetical protein M1819_003034 [Sarea resinae]|nr:MAG: hypothetical protein M1819_003034 [Sarea resinae]